MYSVVEYDCYTYFLIIVSKLVHLRSFKHEFSVTFPLGNLYTHEYNVKYRTKLLRSNYIQQTRLDVHRS